MKTLTLWQPWASLIIAGCKPYEFRSWRPPASVVGQRIVIHASARKVVPREVEQLRRLLEAGGRYAAQTCLTPIEDALRILALAEFPLAAGLDSAIAGEPRSGADIGADFGALNAVNDSDRHLHCNWGWPTGAEVRRAVCAALLSRTFPRADPPLVGPHHHQQRNAA